MSVLELQPVPCACSSSTWKGNPRPLLSRHSLGFGSGAVLSISCTAREGKKRERKGSSAMGSISTLGFGSWCCAQHLSHGQGRERKGKGSSEWDPSAHRGLDPSAVLSISCLSGEWKVPPPWDPAAHQGLDPSAVLSIAPHPAQPGKGRVPLPWDPAAHWHCSSQTPDTR